MQAREWRPLSRVNPLTKLGVAVGYIIAVTVLFDLPFQILLLTVTVLALLALERVPPLKLAGIMLPFALMGAGYLWTNLFFHRQSGAYVESLGRFSLMRNPALDDGLIVFLRALNFGAISYLFAHSTSPADLARGLMQHARVPASIAFSVFAAVQFIPQMLDDLRQLRLAHRLREPGRARRWITAPRRFAGITITLLAGAVRRAQRSAISMEARGLRQKMTRSQLRRSSFGRPDGLFLAATVVVLALLVAIASGGAPISP